MSDLNDQQLNNRIVDLETELRKLKQEQHTRLMVERYPNYVEIKAEWEKILTALLTLRNLGEQPETYDNYGDLDSDLFIEGIIMKIENGKLVEN